MMNQPSNARKIEDVFGQIESAVQTNLPGSDFHERYTNVGSVGLAYATGLDVDFPRNGILYPRSPLVVLSNLADYPEAWSHEGVDYEDLLGRGRQPGVGRFVEFALAKAACMAGESVSQSSFNTQLKQGQGRVGFAGALRSRGRIHSYSGLWELHDNLCSRVSSGELNNSNQPTKESIAVRIERGLEQIANMHPGIPAAELTRQELATILAGEIVRR